MIIALFVACKSSHLSYPFYWDESWPYAAAIKEMYLHGPSIIPGAINSDLSRGHPLFFHAASAVWMRFFGPSNFSLHAFALLISVTFLVFIYEALIRLFNATVAGIGLLLITTQVPFFVQSSFVLPEVLVAFMAFAGLVFYVCGRHVLTALCLTILFFTKESGLVLGLVLGFDALIGLFSKDCDWRIRLYRLLSVALPGLAIFIFFVLQRHLLGWYFFPSHTNLIVQKWGDFWYGFSVNCLVGVFNYNHRYYYFLLLSVLATAVALKTKNLKFLIFAMPVAIGYCMVNVRLASQLQGLLLLLLFHFSIAVMLFVLLKSENTFNTTQKRFVVLAWIFIVSYLLFTSVNFFTPRYLIAAIVPVMVTTAIIVNFLIDTAGKTVLYAFLVCSAVIAIKQFRGNRSFGDIDLGAFDGMYVHQKVVDYFEQNNYYDKSIGCLFMLNKNLVLPATGYLNGSKAFRKAAYTIDDKTDFAIFDNVETDYRYEFIKKDSNFHLVQRYEKGMVWAEIYARK